MQNKYKSAYMSMHSFYHRIVYIYFILFRYILTSTLMIVSATHGAIHMVHSVYAIVQSMDIIVYFILFNIYIYFYCIRYNMIKSYYFRVCTEHVIQYFNINLVYVLLVFNQIYLPYSLFNNPHLGAHL